MVGLRRFTSYSKRSDFKRVHAMALASFVPPSEDFIMGIDCADRWFFTKWGTKLALTSERLVAFRPDPSNPTKRSYWLDDIQEVKYETGLLTAELRVLGSDFYETYPVPRYLGRELFEAIQERLN